MAQNTHFCVKTARKSRWILHFLTMITEVAKRRRHLRWALQEDGLEVFP